MVGCSKNENNLPFYREIFSSYKYVWMYIDIFKFAILGPDEWLKIEFSFSFFSSQVSILQILDLPPNHLKILCFF